MDRRELRIWMKIKYSRRCSGSGSQMLRRRDGREWVALSEVMKQMDDVFDDVAAGTADLGDALAAWS